MQAKTNKRRRRQHQAGQSNTELYKHRRVRILLAIAAGSCLFHLVQCSTKNDTTIQAQETTESPMMAINATSTSINEANEEQQSEAQNSTATSTTTTNTATESPTIQDNNRLTTITIFKIQKQALHNSGSSESWLIDKSTSDPPTTRSAAGELARSSPSPLASSSIASSPVPLTVTPASKSPSVLRPSIEEVASKLSRKHLNLEHDNWRLRQPAQVSASLSSASPQSPSSLFDDTTKSADGSAESLPIEAEQDIQQVSSPASQPTPQADSNQQQPAADRGSGVFSSTPPKLNVEGQVNREHYLHTDVASAAATANQPKSGRPTGSGGAGPRRKKSGFLTGEPFEIFQCHQYLRIYNAPSSSSSSAGDTNPAAGGLYQMISHQQLPCSCEMRSSSFSTDHNEQQSTTTLTSWLSCDQVQLVGGYPHPVQRAPNSSGDTWDMGKVSATAELGGGPIQVTRFSQRHSGLQSLQAQKFLNLQLTNLKSIDLSDNRIRQIKTDAFHGLELSLENLNLANNLLGDSRAISQISAPNAQPPAHASKSKLIFFTDEFHRLKKLKWLSLRNNKINQMNPTIFTKPPQQSTSFIQQQDSGNLKELPRVDADGSTSAGRELIYLDLSENILKTVPSEAISALNSLQALNLKGNKIVQLDHQSKFPKSLKYLDLSENLIKIIHHCDLIDLPDLIELNLSHNQLSHLDKTAFLSSTSVALAAATATAPAPATNKNLQPPSSSSSQYTNVDAASESSLSSPTNNLSVQNAFSDDNLRAGSQLLASGGGSNNDERTKILDGSVNEDTKSSLLLDAQQAGPKDALADLLSLADVGEPLSGQPRRRTRRDVISGGGGGGGGINMDKDELMGDSAIVVDEDDLDAEESSLSSSISLAAASQQTSQRTLPADDQQQLRRQREFNSTIKLNLAYNYFTSLPGDSLLKFPNLQQLDLSYNRIRYLDSNYLCSIYNLVESLRELDLGGNLLALPQANNSTSATPTATADGATTLPGRQLNRLFGCLQKLERLSLGTNRLSSSQASQPSTSRSKAAAAYDESVPGEDAFSSGATKTLGDSHDRLHIKFGDNYGSRYLNQLDLSDNQLRRMPLIEQVFQQPTMLTANNKRLQPAKASSDGQSQDQLNQWMASRVYLVGLNLSYNYIDHLEERDFDHLFSLRQLSLDFNRLSSLPTKLMRKFTSLDRASFEGNRLSSLEPLNELLERSIRTLRHLNLANNRLTIWPAVNKVLYENPLRPEFGPSLQINSEDRQASALQFALEELNLEGNLFTSSNVSTLFDQFAYMKSLKILNLSQNLLSRVRSEWFKFANDNLRKLSLAGNKINSIDLGSFVYNQLNELQQLNLDHNLLKELKRKTFDSLPKLRQVDLSHNFIHTINSETFNQMSALQALNLSNNKLTSWKCEYFTNLCNSISGNINADLSALLSVGTDPNTDRQQPVSSLTDLDLSHNSLSQLRVNSISVHTKLEHLNLAHNKLSYIPHDLFRATILDPKTGRQIQLVSSLRRLNLAHNRIQTVDNLNLRPLRNLINFDLSHNELQTLGLDVILIDGDGNNRAGMQQRERNNNIMMVGNNVTNLLTDNTPVPESQQQQRQPRTIHQQPDNSNPALGKLRHLNLSHNQLTQVNQSLLHELSPFVLLNLDLSHNYLESDSLPYGFYAKISASTSSKQQPAIPKSANYDLVFTLKLESIDLSHNRLSEFPSDLLENHHISMESCNLARNRIQSLAPNSNILIQIKTLNLEFNPLNRESNELILFEHKSARQLNLAATRLYAIKEVTQSLQNIGAGNDQRSSSSLSAQNRHRLVANQTSQLDLIRSISKPIDAPYVQHLNLSSNQLVWLAANIFERMHSLQTLDLSNNQLTRLHLLTNQLSPLSASLERLNLASNLFTSIDSTDFSQLSRLQHLDLSSLLSLQKLNCRFLSKLTTLKSLRLFNFPQVRQNLNNILANLQQRNHQRDSHASSLSQGRLVRKLQQELLVSTIGSHCFRDEQLSSEPPDQLLPAGGGQQQDSQPKWFNLRDLELELFSTFDEDSTDEAATIERRSGFELREELAQLLGPQTRNLTLFGLNLTGLADNSLLGITGQQLDLKISFTSLARLPLEQVLGGISKRTKLNLDFRNNNIQTLDVGSLQILDELQLNGQILPKGDHSSLRLAANPMRCDCQTRPLWLWLNQRWANSELASNQPEAADQQASADTQASAGGNSANYWLKFSSVLQTSDIKCHHPAKLRGKLAQYVNYHDLVCKGSSPSSGTSGAVAGQSIASRQSRKRNDTKTGGAPELSYYSKDGYGGDIYQEEDGANQWGENSADYYDLDSSTPDGAAATTPVRVTKFNRFPSIMYNQTIYFLQSIPSVPFFVSDNHLGGRQSSSSGERGEFDLEDLPESPSGSVSRMGKRDGNSVEQSPIYPILSSDRPTVNTKYSKHRPNSQQRHSSFDTLSALKQFQPAHHLGNHSRLLTDSDVYILTVMSVAMSIMSFIIIAICLVKHKLDRSEKEQILTDHGKMLMSQALFDIHQASSFKPKHHSTSSGGGNGSKKSSSSSGDSSSSSNDQAAATKRTTSQPTPMTTTAAAVATVAQPKSMPHRSNDRSVLVQLRDAASPSGLAVPAAAAAAQNFLMRSPTVRRMQGLATNASDWFKYTLRAYPSNAAAAHCGGQRRGRRLFLGDTVPVASQLTTGRRGIEEQLADNEPGSPATLAVGCPQHAFRAVDKLRDRRGFEQSTIEEKCLHCARLLATIQQTKVQYLVGSSGDKNHRESGAAKQQQHADPTDDDADCLVPPSLIRALAEQLDQANAGGNYVGLAPEWLQQQQQLEQADDREAPRASSFTAAYYKRGIRAMRTFGVKGDEQQQQQQQRQRNQAAAPAANGAANSRGEGSQIPGLDVIGRFAYQSDSQVDTPTPYDARCSSMLGGSSQMDGSEDTNGHYNRDGVFVLVPDDTSSGEEATEPVSVLLNQRGHPTNQRPDQRATRTTTADRTESRSTDQQEDSIRMQDECSRSSSPVAYGFMRSSGPNSLASSSTAQQSHRYQGHHHSNHHHHYATANIGHCSSTSNTNTGADNYSVVRKRSDHTGATTRQDEAQQVIISRL